MDNTIKGKPGLKQELAQHAAKLMLKNRQSLTV